MKKRVAYLIIDGKRFGDTESGLNVSFDVPYTGTNLVPNNATFTLTNLKSSDLAHIVTNTSLFTERKRKIECWAGYSDNVKKIFAGQIYQASPTDIPDTNITITAMSNINAMGSDHVIRSFKNIKFIDLIKDAAQACGYIDTDIQADVRNSERLQAIAGTNWTFEGSAYEYLQRVQRDLLAHTDQRKRALAFVVSKDILYVSWQNIIYPSTIPVISAESGLIGIPSPTECGIKAQILLDVSLNALQSIRIQSKQLELYNGIYNIINLRHHGSLRGRDWYTELDCVRIGR